MVACNCVRVESLAVLLDLHQFSRRFFLMTSQRGVLRRAAFFRQVFAAHVAARVGREVLLALGTPAIAR